jgi:surface antigen
MRKRTLLLAATLATVWTAQLCAEPPAHAPAHGWRKKNDPHYVGYTGTKWERDYEISSGRCNREQIGAVIGGVAGGVIGSRVGSPENLTVAIIIGAAAGALLGAKIGQEMDEGDRRCIGHALEIGSAGHRVTWENRETGVWYALVPGKSGGSSGKCREFTLTATHGSENSKRTGKACQSSTGVWKVVSA